MPPFAHNHTTQYNTLNNTPLYLLTPQQGAFCGVCSADSNGMSYHRSLGQCKPCEGSMLPAVAGLLVALTVLLMLLAALRTSKGRKLLSKLQERAKKQKDDGPMTKGFARMTRNQECQAVKSWPTWTCRLHSLTD